MSTDVQTRGAAQATQEARTLASRVIDVNTTDGRMAVHNGSEPGGVPHVNYIDEQNQEFTYAAATGTNSIVITLAKAPAAYAAGQCFTFKALNSTTGAATLNVNSLGALTLKKKDRETTTIVAAVSGDVIAGGFYKVHVIDGSNCLLESVDGAITSVSQGDLNTSSGTFSTTTDTVVASNLRRTATSLTLPGGQYGFTLESNTAASVVGGWWHGYHAGAYTPNVFAWTDDVGHQLISGRQTYVTASPPYDLGDGIVQGFMFMKFDSNNKLIGHYIADTPPWGYNGKTKTRACAVCPITGKKFRSVLKHSVRDILLNGASEQTMLEEITNEIKNRDMVDIPHPFGILRPGETVAMADPMSDLLGKMINQYNEVGNQAIDEIQSMLIKNQLYLDNDKMNRAGPAGVDVFDLRIK